MMETEKDHVSPFPPPSSNGFLPLLTDSSSMVEFKGADSRQTNFVLFFVIFFKGSRKVSGR